MQPAEPVNIIPVNISPVNIAQNVTEHIPQTSKDSGADSDAKIWLFDQAINEVFRLLPQELCPKTQQEKTPAKPLWGIEHLMESRSIPLLVLPSLNLLKTQQNLSKIDLIWISVVETGYVCKTWSRLLLRPNFTRAKTSSFLRTMFLH